MTYIDPTGNTPIDYAYDPLFLAMSWDVYESNPTILNAVAFGIDAVLTAIPYVPAVGGIALRGMGKFFSKADDIERVSRLTDNAGEAGKIVTDTKAKTIVIGENMDRVRKAAKEFGVETFEGKTLTENKAWIKQHKKSGSKVIDIGQDFERRSQLSKQSKTPWSKYYNMERKETVGYEKVEKLWERKGKFEGETKF